MLIYGIHAIREALEASPDRVRRLLIAKGRHGGRLARLVDDARQAGVPVHFEPPAALQRRVGADTHQGAVAEMSEAPIHTLDEVLEARPGLLLIADGVEDPRNLGALLRTADAAGVDAVLLPDRHTTGLTPAVARTSAGALHHLPIARIGNVHQTLERLKTEGFTIVGLDPEGSEGLAEAVSFPVAVVVGGESRGLRPLVARTCDWRVRLPMRGRVASLNLSVAAGILLYQLGDRRPLPLTPPESAPD